ncbi:S1C family serine protease [Humibacillus xanthopallidus]|uniref:S1C family serine protease n=1 Tax=Humibacillus xanthopallidus TaxID=412689 RepID=UPI00384C2876
MARVTAPQQVSGAAPAGGAPAPPAPRSPRLPRLLRRARRVPARLWWTSIAVLAVAALAISYALTRPPPPADLTRADVTAGVQAGLEQQAEQDAARPSDATLAHAAVAPSLVLITTRSGSGESGRAGSGAGVVVNADGTVLTALHVVDGAESITVSFSDGTNSAATIEESTPASDIATLRPQRLPDTVVPAVLGGGVQVGSSVFAVGHPLGLTDSLSAGVVSALDRTVTVEGDRKLEDLIQFDAAVNPGNSGGPLLNKAGQVVGIVTGLANPSDQALFVGIGFAVPIATAGGSAGAPPH